MKNILLLTDFSDNALNAIDYALQLFKEEDCKFWLLHVKTSSDYISDDLISNSSTSVYDSLFANVKQELNTLIETLQHNSRYQDLKIEALLDYDQLTNAVNQVSMSKNIDMIIMGTNGVTGAKEVIFGSHTINIAKHAIIPTLVIPQNYPFHEPKTLFLPLDASDPLEGPMMEAFVAFANKYKLKVKVVRVGIDDTQKTKNLDLEKLNKFSPNLNYTYEYIAHKTVFETLDIYLTKEKADMMGLFLQKESLLQRLFKQSSTNQIANYLDIPLLMFHY